jgi:hypothetical protein
MSVLRRKTPFLALTTILVFIWLFKGLRVRDSWTKSTLERIGIGELDTETSESPLNSTSGGLSDGFNSNKTPTFRPGTVKPPGYNYTKRLIIARMTEEDVTWIELTMGHMIRDGTLETKIYVADDPTAPLHPPKNKGHEVMIYLTYIIDHYDDLADVNIFMHSHRISWHNNDLAGQDASDMIKRLSPERIQREGYMNLRCHWGPGCPDWIHPGTINEDINKQEETVLAKSWSELFPLDPVPQVLAQACGAQFALTRDRIQQIPKSKFVIYRNWMLRTPLSDYISGRVWEYLWQFIFTGQNIYCPKEHICYCDGYGICFGGEKEYVAYWEKDYKKKQLEQELREWRVKEAIKKATEEGRIDENEELEVPEWGRDIELEEKIEEINHELDVIRDAAKAKGDDPMNRALEAGRTWGEGDGF